MIKKSDESFRERHGVNDRGSDVNERLDLTLLIGSGDDMEGIVGDDVPDPQSYKFCNFI